MAFTAPYKIKNVEMVVKGTDVQVRVFTLAPGETAKTVIHSTDPGPVPAQDCQQASATLVTLRVPSLKHTWRLPLTADVCTTFQYRPDSTPLAT